MKKSPTSDFLPSDLAVPFGVVVAFALVLSVTGGTSHWNVIHLAFLRAFSALVLIPAVYYISTRQLLLHAHLIIFYAMLAIWMSIQLVPLPTAWLGGFESALGDASSKAQVLTQSTTRSISWVPIRGWNALAALIVPIAALALALALKSTSRLLLVLIIGLGLADSFMGIVQSISGGLDGLYLYRMRNPGSADGLFSNENHSGVFSAIVMLVCTRLIVENSRRAGTAYINLVCSGVFCLSLLSVLVGGSRAGLATGLFALSVGFGMVLIALQPAATATRFASWLNRIASYRWIPAFSLAGTALLLVAVFWLFDRAPGLREYLSRDTFEDLRWSIYPIVAEMTADHWFLGIGFGSFEEVYHLYETSDLLFPRFINQAHNDWLQFPLEGGLPAVTIAAGLLAWIVKSCVTLTTGGRDHVLLFVFWSAVFAILCLASFIDYPLRAPITQVVATWLLVCLGCDRMDKSQNL